MSLKKFILFFSFLLISVFVFGQKTIVKGQILDADTDEPLPFATAIFTGTTIGVTCDLDGYFELITNDLTLKTISLSYVGYKTNDEKINPGELNEKVYKIKPNRQEIDAVEIKAQRKVAKDTAAIMLYRKVVENKYRNDPSNYQYYQYKQYSKTEFGFYDLSEKFKESKLVQRFDYVLNNIDTTESGVEVLPILLKETLEQVYFRKEPGKKKTILLGDQFSGVDNFSVGDLVDYNFEDIEIYTNLIRVNGKPFMSPFADNARLSYKYFLTDTAVIDGLTCYKLEFTGKGNADAAFSGYTWIHDSTYAIKSIRLEVLPTANINFISDFIVQQDFHYYNNEFWIKSYEFLQTEYNLLKKKNEEKQSFLVRKSISRSDITVNDSIADDLLEGEERIINEGARTQNEVFWDSMRTEKLKPHEENIFSTVDSIKNSRFYKSLRWFTYMGTSGWMDAKYVEFGKIFQIFSWNAVEGNRIRLGMRTKPALTKRIEIAPYAAYGTKDHLWKYGLETRLHLKRKNEKWHMLGAKHTYDMAQIMNNNPILRPTVTPYDNIVASLLRTDPLDDLFLLRHTNAFYEREWIKGLNTRFAFDHKINYSVPTGTIFSTTEILGDTVTVNKFTTSEFTLNLVWGKDLKFYNSNFARFPIVSHKPVVYFDYTTGVKGLFQADFNYHKFLIGIRQRLLSPLGFTVYTAEAAITAGKGTPYTLLTLHDGNESYLYDQYSFNAMNESEFVSDKFISFSAVHHFDGLVLDKIPGISKLQLRGLFSFRGIYGFLDKKNEKVLHLPEKTSGLNGIYMEAGFGLENILKVLRVDIMFRITQRDKPDINKWALKFTVSPNF
jgi:hypothetical protein